MADNEWNTRYVAEAWIDDGKDEEFKKSFLLNLLEQIQHHKEGDDGFDADMLDGKHYCDISREIKESIQDLVKSFEIGKLLIDVTKSQPQPYVIGFDGVTLWSDAEGYEDEDKTLPWDDEPRVTSPSLLKVFEELYEKHQEDVTTLMSLKELLENAGAIDLVHGQINATSLCGLKVMIVSETAYNTMKDNNDSRINDITYIFIVRPDEELEAAGYPSGIYTPTPETAELNRYYQFRILSYSDGKWLVYRHQDDALDDETDETSQEYINTWKKMVPVSQFLDDDTVNQQVHDFLSKSDNYTINLNVLESTFKNLEFPNNSKLVDYLRDNYIQGAFFDERLPNGTTQQTQVPTQKIGNALNLNLNVLENSDLIQDINDTIAELNNKINTLNGNLNNINETVTNHGSRIQTLETDFSKPHNPTISSIHSSWVYYTGFWEGSEIYYNEKLRLVYYQIEAHIPYYDGVTDSWSRINVGRLSQDFWPAFDIVFPCSPYRTLKITHDGYYEISSRKITSNTYVLGAVTYPTGIYGR